MSPFDGFASPIARTCESCEKPLIKHGKWSWQYFATRRFCDRTCQFANRPRIDVDYLIVESGCWEWQAPMDANGYAKCYDSERPAGQRVDWVHRVSYRKHKGEIPDRFEVDHMCENTRCVNPDHLEAVSKTEHVRRTFQRMGVDERHLHAASLRRLGLTYSQIADVLGVSDKASASAMVQSAIRKGLVSGSDIPRAVHITEQEREDMRDLFAMGIPQSEIAAWYEIDNSQVSRICNGKTSGHSRLPERERVNARREVAA